MEYKLLDNLQNAVYENELSKNNSKKRTYNFDKLSLYFGEDYYVNGIAISQPTIGDILHVKEKNFYKAMNPFIRNSTSIRVMLWESGLDWCNVRDIEVFSMLMNLLDTEDENIKKAFKLIFKKIDITTFKLFKTNLGDLFLYSDVHKIVLKEDDFMEMAEYIREMLSIHPKTEKAKGKITKQWMIDEDKMNAIQKPDKDTDSNLLSLVSGCINHPGFKYNLQELKDVGIYQFFDSVRRLQVYESSRALLNGKYTGFCDLSKVDENLFNFIRDIK